MIRTVQGNLFESGAHALVHPMNCKGVMSNGLAREFKHRFPHEHAIDLSGLAVLANRSDGVAP